MGRVIAVANQKGSIRQDYNCRRSRSSSIAAAEVDTLLVDCDPQSNATSGFGLVEDPQRISTYHLLMRNASAERLCRRLSSISCERPSHKNLIGANLELVDGERREFRLRDAFAVAEASFQYIVLDCPPALDLLTLNALVAADSIAVRCRLVLEGVSELLDTVDASGTSLNPELTIEGVVLTMFDDSAPTWLSK